MQQTIISRVRVGKGSNRHPPGRHTEPEMLSKGATMPGTAPQKTPFVTLLPAARILVAHRQDHTSGRFVRPQHYPNPPSAHSRLLSFFSWSARAAVVQSRTLGCSLISLQCWDDWGRQDQAYQLCDWKMVIGDKNIKEDTLVVAVAVLLESGW